MTEILSGIERSCKQPNTGEPYNYELDNHTWYNKINRGPDSCTSYEKFWKC